MTIRLLAAYGPYPHNAIISLSAAEEAQLVAAKFADTNLTGGVAYVPLDLPPYMVGVLMQQDPDTRLLAPPTLTERAVASLAYGCPAMLMADRPPASDQNDKFEVWITDDNGGTLYRSNGVSWEKRSPGLAEVDVPTVLWAELGTGAVGQRKRIVDPLFNQPVLVEWNGTRWQPVNGIAKIHRQAGVVNGTAGTTSTATSALLTLPGGMLGPEGGWIMEACFSASASPTAATPAATWDSSALFDGVSVGTKRNVRIRRSCRNVGSDASQIVNEAQGDLGGPGTGSGAVQTFTKNTANARTLQASCTFTHASSIVATLHSFDVWWVA